MKTNEYPPGNIVRVILGICLSYLIFQLFYIPHAALSVDEFFFSYNIHDYTQKMPYRDFLPYKTVLGYYLLSVPLLIWHSLLQPIYYIKDEIAIINTFFLAGVSLWLSRFYPPKAVIFSLLCIIASHLFLIYSVDVRIDMLTGWLCLGSILLVLSGRFIFAGLLLSLSFMVSQKTIWFFAATNLALGCYWLVIYRKSQVIYETFIFNLAVIIPFSFYIIFWSMHSSLATVTHSVFVEGYHVWKLSWYSQIYRGCWMVILSNGPLLMLLWPLTWISCVIRTVNDQAEFPRRFFIMVYSTTILLFIVNYQQAFPYGMVLAVPALFLMYPDFFSWIITLFQKKSALKSFNHRAAFWFISLYTIASISLMIVMMLPFAYYLIALIPICLGLFLLVPPLKNALTHAILIILICTGIIYPVIRFGFTTVLLDNRYQKSMVMISDTLLKEGGGFFAGTPLLYNHDQAILGLNNLIGPSIEYLSKPSEKLLPIIIPSLYLQPRTTGQVLHDLKITPVKFYVNNYRIESLPRAIHHYLTSEFDHYWGSIYIYAPRILAKKQSIQIKFSGHYKIMTRTGNTIYLDHKKRVAGQIIYLKNGMHISYAEKYYRLKYTPDIAIKLDSRDAHDNWDKFVKPIVI